MMSLLANCFRWMEESVFWTHLTTLNALRDFMAMTNLEMFPTPGTTDTSPRRHHGNPIMKNEVTDTTNIQVIDIEVDMNILLPLTQGAGDTVVIGVIVRVVIASNLRRTSLIKKKGMKEATLTEVPKGNMEMME